MNTHDVIEMGVKAQVSLEEEALDRTEASAARQPVDYRRDAIHPEFERGLALIAGYAGTKYKDPLQYFKSRLTGDRGPVNHALNHLGQYRRGEPHDHFGPDPRWHLLAAAYNLMMEFGYVSAGNEPDIWPFQFDPLTPGV